jgi:Gas vesicle synthesis protein GvpL/GvpF
MPAATQPGEPAAAPPRGCYVYGIVPHDVQPVPGATGVGDPPAQVQVVRSGAIAALVSEIDLTHPLGQPEDLRAHQQLLDGAATEVPVLPFRFGAVMTDAQAVAEELLAPHEQEFAAALEELDGRVEYVIKGRYAEQAVLREVLTENTQAARLWEGIRRVGNQAATRNLRLQLGELINQAISAKRAADTRALGDVLAGHVVTSSVREPTHEMDAAHVAVLAETAHHDELENAISQLARDWQGRITLRLLGPMAPYDFAITQPPGSPQ